MQEWYAISQTPLTSDTISITTTDTGDRTGVRSGRFWNIGCKYGKSIRRQSFATKDAVKHGCLLPECG